MPRQRFLLLGVVVLLCLVPVGYIAFINNAAHRASAYGISAPGKSALVIENNTTDFYVTRVVLDNKIVFMQAIDQGSRIALEIAPGEHEISVTFSEQRDRPGIPVTGYFADSNLSAKFFVTPGRAAIFSVTGGDVSGVLYTAPILKAR